MAMHFGCRVAVICKIRLIKIALKTCKLWVPEIEKFGFNCKLSHFKFLGMAKIANKSKPARCVGVRNVKFRGNLNSEW